MSGSRVVCFILRPDLERFACVLISTRDASYNEEEGSLRMYLRGRPVVLYAPTNVADNYDITKVAPPPQAKLKLDWVYPFEPSLNFLSTAHRSMRGFETTRPPRESTFEGLKGCGC